MMVLLDNIYGTKYRDNGATVLENLHSFLMPSAASSLCSPTSHEGRPLSMLQTLLTV
jgi:hypothetical protein